MTKKMIMNMAEKLSAKVELYNSYDPDFHREKAQRLKELDLFVQGVRCFDPENIRITFEDNEHSFGFRKNHRSLHKCMCEWEIQNLRREIL